MRLSKLRHFAPGYPSLSMLCLMVCSLILASCSPITVNDYAGNKPKIVMEQFFDGPLTAHGVVKDRSGKVIRSFNATIDASWEQGVGTLDEQFIFDDGEQQQRIWQLTKTAEGRYIGTANDVVGEGEINVAGNSVFLDYILRIDYQGEPLDLRIDDRMYLTSDNVMINESTMTKWGFNVGSLLLVIKK